MLFFRERTLADIIITLIFAVLVIIMMVVAIARRVQEDKDLNENCIYLGYESRDDRYGECLTTCEDRCKRYGNINYQCVESCENLSSKQ